MRTDEIEKFLTGQMTADERISFEEEIEMNDDLREDVAITRLFIRELRKKSLEEDKMTIAAIKQQMGKGENKRFRWIVAACLLSFIMVTAMAAGIYHYVTQQKESIDSSENAYQTVENERQNPEAYFQQESSEMLLEKETILDMILQNIDSKDIIQKIRQAGMTSFTNVDFEHYQIAGAEQELLNEIQNRTLLQNIVKDTLTINDVVRKAYQKCNKKDYISRAVNNHVLAGIKEITQQRKTIIITVDFYSMLFVPGAKMNLGFSYAPDSLPQTTLFTETGSYKVNKVKILKKVRCSETTSYHPETKKTTKYNTVPFRIAFVFQGVPENTNHIRQLQIQGIEPHGKTTGISFYNFKSQTANL